MRIMPPADPTIHGCTCALLRRLNRRLTAVYDRTLAPLGLRVTQYSLLSNLRRSPQPTLTELAALLDMDRTTLTRNLKPLVDAGWVRMRQGGQDARARNAELTTAGRELLETARPLWRRAQDEINATIGRAEVARLHALADAALPRLRPADDGDLA
jgi:DNA-binding MarR family transcriptional regulator